MGGPSVIAHSIDRLSSVEYYPLEFFRQFKPYCRTFWETIEQ